MANSAGGITERRTVIKVGVDVDPAAQRALEGVANRFRKIQSDARSAASQAIKEGMQEREREFQADVKFLSEREQRAKKAADEEEKALERKGSLMLRQWQRGQQYRREQDRSDREQMRRGAEMAREYDRQLAHRDSIERHYEDVRRRRAESRSFGNAVGGAQIGSGVLQAGRGLAEFGAAHAMGDTAAGMQNLVHSIVQIQGVYDSLAGLRQVASGLGRTGMGRDAQAFGLRGLRGIAGTVGATGLGGGLGAVGAAGLAAGAGVGAAGISAFQFGRDVWNNGLGGGSTPGGWSDTIGGTLAGAGAGIVTGLGIPATGARNFLRNWVRPFGIQTPLEAGLDWQVQEDKFNRMDAARRNRLESEADIFARDQANASDWSRSRMGSLATEFQDIGLRFGHDPKAALAATDKSLTGNIAALEREKRDLQAGGDVAGAEARERVILSLMEKQKATIQAGGEIRLQDLNKAIQAEREVAQAWRGLGEGAINEARGLGAGLRSGKDAWLHATADERANAQSALDKLDRGEQLTAAEGDLLRRFGSGSSSLQNQIEGNLANSPELAGFGAFEGRAMDDIEAAQAGAHEANKIAVSVDQAIEVRLKDAPDTIAAAVADKIKELMGEVSRRTNALEASDIDRRTAAAAVGSQRSSAAGG